MDDLIAMAEKLGKQIAADARTMELKQAQKAVDQDEEAKKLVEAYRVQAERISELTRQNKPIEVVDKHKLRELEQQIGLNGKLKELTRRQVDFVDMMRKIKQAIDSQLEV